MGLSKTVIANPEPVSVILLNGCSLFQEDWMQILMHNQTMLLEVFSVGLGTDSYLGMG